MKRWLRLTFILIAALALSLATTSAAPVEQAVAPAGNYPVHALIIEADPAGNAVLTGYRQTAQSTPLATMDMVRHSASLNTPMNNADPVSVQLIDSATGTVVYQTVAAAPNAVRGEFAVDPANPALIGFDGSAITRVTHPLDRRVFSVRLPVISGATRVSIQPFYGTRSISMIDLDAAAVTFGAADAVVRGPHEEPPVLYNLNGYTTGASDNRVDVLIMGDGYTTAEASKFRSDARAFADGMFAIHPYSTYRNFFNVKAVYGASVQNGADRPVQCNVSNSPGCCPDSNPSWSAQTRDTRYDSTFCSANIARLLVAEDIAKIYADADLAYPDWDEIWLIVNDTTYGGSGGAIAVASINPYGVEIQQHEVGHSLMRLADEYGGTAGNLFCNDRNINQDDNCPPNITNQTDRTLLKWNYWVSPTTPIPTSGGLPDPNAAGLWRGAGYSDSAGYRACFDCIMRVLGRPFGVVAAEMMPIVLYEGGWEGSGSYWGGTSSGTGVSMVDSYSPTNDSTITIPTSASQTFSAQVVGPNGTSVSVRWSVSAAVVKTEVLASGATTTYTLTPTEMLMGTPVTLEVTDIHSTLHPQNRAVSTTTVVWTVDANGAPNAGTELLTNGGFETADLSGENRAAGWLQGTDRGKRRCPDGFAFSGLCAYDLRPPLAGGPGGITQELVVNGTPYADAGDLLVARAVIRSQNLNGQFEMRPVLRWSDGTTSAFKFRAVRGSAPYRFYEAFYQLSPTETRTIDSILVRVRFVKGTGRVRVDDVRLTHYPDFLPPAP